MKLNVDRLFSSRSAPRHRAQAILLGIFCLCLAGCGIIRPAVRTENNLKWVEKDEERKMIIYYVGKPDKEGEVLPLPEGQSVRVDEYRLYDNKAPLRSWLWGFPSLTFFWWFPKGEPMTYLFRYVDDKLSAWGREGGLDE